MGMKLAGKGNSVRKLCRNYLRSAHPLIKQRLYSRLISAFVWSEGYLADVNVVILSDHDNHINLQVGPV